MQTPAGQPPPMDADNTLLFKQKAPGLMQKLIDRYGLDPVQAAAVAGNVGHESNGLNNLREIGQPRGKGGYGWCQWTGPRRRDFLEWCEAKSLDWRSDEANIGFLLHELDTSERPSLIALHKTVTLEAAVIAFERGFERAGVPNYPSRNRWAAIAMAAYKESP